MNLKEALAEIYKTAKEKYKFQNTPKLVLKEDEEDNYDEGQPSWQQEWEDFGEVYSDEY